MNRVILLSWLPPPTQPHPLTPDSKLLSETTYLNSCENHAGARQDGHSRFPAPRPEGGLESSGPLVPGHGRPPRSTPLGRRGPDQRTGSGGGPAQRAQPGLEWLGVGMRQDLRTPQPTPQAPRASTPTLPVTGVSWKPFGPPRLTRWFLVWCWQCSGGGPVSAGWSPVGAVGF